MKKMMQQAERLDNHELNDLIRYLSDYSELLLAQGMVEVGHEVEHQLQRLITLRHRRREAV